ncbi:MAG: F0F1 ATP synthase subunit A [Chloroflexi bacterium]|nr:F0F1 ATP synthase subunit A [Chloroflexota bacterium]
MKGLFSEVVFTIFGIPVRDTVLSTWIMLILLTAIVYLLGRRRPAALELLVEFVLDSVSSVMGRPAAPYLPLLGTLAVFIAAANTLGAVPILVSPTKGINTPFALALIVFFSVHYFGIRDKGLTRYLKELADPIFLLPLELIGQFSRTLSLTLRLFGNVLSTDLIVAVIFSLLPLIVPIPLIAFSMLTGLLQAYIFTVLAAVYIGAAVAANESIPSEKRS